MAGYVFYPRDKLGFDIATAFPRMAAWMTRVAATLG